MTHQPNFRRVAHSSRLRLEPTAEATQVAEDNRNKSFVPAKSPALVDSLARCQLRVKTVSPALVLAYSEIQFGQYRGQSFKWLLENAAGYAVGLIESVRKEGRANDSPLGVNKHKFVEYATSFPEISEALEDRELNNAAESKAKTTGDDGERLVGFSTYHRMSRKALFDSDDKQHKSFVRFVLKKTNCIPGSQMQHFRDYCVRRQQQNTERQTSPADSKPSTSKPPTADDADDDETDVEDEELLAAVRVIESQYYFIFWSFFPVFPCILLSTTGF